MDQLHVAYLGKLIVIVGLVSLVFKGLTHMGLRLQSQSTLLQVCPRHLTLLGAFMGLR